MTTEELCGHRWRRPWATHWRDDDHHRCDLPADHRNWRHIPRPCACRCGATTTEETTDA